MYAVSLDHLGSPRWALHRELPQWVQDQGMIVSGSLLAHVGLPMPSLLPESSFLIRLDSVIHS
jgi:hypothetical protein